MSLTPQTPPGSTLPLQTLSPSGTPPRQRLASASDAQSLFWTLKDSARIRLSKAAVIQSMFDGAPPYDPAKLRQMAQAWRPNFNSLEASSRLESAKTPFYDLFSSTPLHVDVNVNVGNQFIDAPQASRVCSSAFDDLLRSFPEFDNQFWTMLTDFVGFNKGFLWWPTPETTFFKRIPWNRVLFPDGTSTDPDDWECFAIEHHWPVHKLWGYARHGGPGWKNSAVIKVIRQAVPDDIAKSYRLDDPMTLQRQLRDNDLWLSSRCSTVHAASVYTREFDGKWSRIVVSADEPNRSKGKSDPASRVERTTQDIETTPIDALFDQPRMADSLYQILSPFIFEVNDGSINELSGLGKRIVSLVQASDRMLNETVQNVMLRSCINLQATSGGSQAKAASVQIGGGIVTLPPGYNVQPATIFGDIDGTLGVSAHIANTLDRNTGIYRPQFEKPQGNPESATAANIRFSQATVLTNSAVNRFYQQLDRFFAEQWRRATQGVPRTSTDASNRAVTQFRDRLEAEGVDDAQIKSVKPVDIRAMRAIGNGSPIMRQQAMSALAQLVAYMGPEGIYNWKVDYAAAFAGTKAANRYFPAADRDNIPTHDEWAASQENADMNQGNPAIFAGWQNSEIHAQVHLAAGFQAVKSVVEGGADPAIPFTFLQTALPHIGQHIAQVGRANIRKELEAAYAQLGKGYQLVLKAAQDSMQQQGQRQQLTFEQQLEIQKLQGDMQIKQVKNNAQMQQRAERHQLDMRQKMEQAGVDASLKKQQAMLADATTAADIQRQAAQAAAQIEIDRKKAEAAAEAARNKHTSDE